jgi:Cysteine-rich secretory protein family
MVISASIASAEATDGGRRRRLKRWAGAFAVVVAALLLPLSAAQAAGGSGQFVSDTNSARSAHGTKALATSSDLTSIAQHWAQQMADSGELSHNPKLTSQVGHWQKLGENVGYGPDVETIQDAFMHSAGHRANILDPDFTQVGIGVVVKDGVVWVSEVFRESDGTQATTHPKAKPAPKQHQAPPAKPVAQQPAKVVEVDHSSPQQQPTATKAAAKTANTVKTVTPAKAVTTKSPRRTSPGAANPTVLAPAAASAEPVSSTRVTLAQGLGSGNTSTADPTGDSHGGSTLPALVALGVLALLLGISLRVRPPV